MSDSSVHVKWKDLADELMRQDRRLLGQGITCDLVRPIRRISYN